MSESLITKKAISTEFKKLCKIKNIEKVSISDITNSCGLNRQTFYYHFQDKYELLNWIYYNELFTKVVDNITFENWNEKIKVLLEIMKSDQAFYVSTIKTSDIYFRDYLHNITCTLFKEAISKLDIGKKLKENDIDFISNFYSFGISGVILSWVKEGMKEDINSITSNLKKLALNTEKLGYEIYSTNKEEA